MSAVAPDEPGVASARGVAIALVVLGHAAVSFLATPIGWAVRDDARWLGADAAVWLIRQFAMPAFFAMGGVAAARLLATRGVRGYLMQRARRVVLPLVIALVPVSLAMNALWDWGREVAARGQVAEAVPHLRGSSLPVTLAHLWFLYYLAALSLGGLAIAAALAGDRAARACDRLVAPLVTRPVLALPVLALPAWAALAWRGQLQLDTPLGFAIDPVVLGYFATFFAWGWWLAARREGLAAIGNALPALAALAVVATAAAVPALLDSRDGARPPLHATAAAALGSWALVATLVGATRRWLPRAPRALATLATDSLWIYVVHLPLVVLVQIVVAPWAWPGPAAYALVAATGLGGSALVARALRRV